METNVQTSNSIRLSDMIKVLFKKIVWIILAVVVGGVIGAGVGFFKTRNTDYYGTTVQFYINPKTEEQSAHQIYGAYSITPMTDMVNLLESGFFSEYLLLDDNGLPSKGISTAIDAKIDAANAVLANQSATDEQKEAAVESAVEEWQKDDSYKPLVSLVSSCITFTQQNTTPSSTIANSFISVEISVLNDKQFADLLLEKIKTKVPEYVEANMYVPNDTLKSYQQIGDQYVEVYKPLYIGTSCQRMSRVDDITLLSGGVSTTTMTKYALIVGFLGAIVACAVVLFVHYRKEFSQPVQSQQTPDEQPTQEEKTE